MNFWENVLLELEYQCKTRKWLAAAAGINVSTIGIGQRRNSMPAADVALKIAGALNVSLEYLLGYDEKSTQLKNNASDGYLENELTVFRKYRMLIHKMECLAEKERNVVEKLVDVLAENQGVCQNK